MAPLDSSPGPRRTPISPAAGARGPMTGDRYRSPRWGRTSARNNRSTFPPAPLGYESKTRNDSILTKLTAWAFPAAAGLKNFRGRHFQGKVFLVVTGKKIHIAWRFQVFGMCFHQYQISGAKRREIFQGVYFSGIPGRLCTEPIFLRQTNFS